MTSHAPFRADEVGSLLRPADLKRARADRESGALDDAGLKEIEDACIRDVVAKQEEAGLQAVTDGEFRRSWWHFDFLTGLDGVEWSRGAAAIQFEGVQTKSESIAVTGKVGFSDHPMLGAFQILEERGECHAEDDHPVSVRPTFSRRPGLDQRGCLPRSRRLLRRHGRRLCQGGRRVLRCRVPVSSV